MSIILSIDPEMERPAFSSWMDGRLITYGKIICQEKGKFHHEFFTYMKTLALHHDELVIEGQYVGENAQAAMRLVEVRAWLSYPFLYYHKPVHVADPLRWQRSLLAYDNRRKGRLPTRAVLKEMSMIKATAIARHYKVIKARQKVDDHNHADAICLGDWHLKNSKLKRRA